MKGVEKVRAVIGLGEAIVPEEAHASQKHYECVKMGGTSAGSDCKGQWHFKTCAGQTHVIGCRCTEGMSQQEFNAQQVARAVNRRCKLTGGHSSALLDVMRNE